MKIQNSMIDKKTMSIIYHCLCMMGDYQIPTIEIHTEVKKILDIPRKFTYIGLTQLEKNGFVTKTCGIIDGKNKLGFKWTVIDHDKQFELFDSEEVNPSEFSIFRE
jgi:hypothetical protein